MRVGWLVISRPIFYVSLEKSAIYMSFFKIKQPKSCIVQLFLLLLQRKFMNRMI